MILRSLVVLPTLLCVAAFASAQVPPKEEPPLVRIPSARVGDDPHQQIQKLIGEVEQHLRQIDKLLSEASVARRPSAGSTATAELVKRSQATGKQVVEAIDKILELANHPHPPGGS